MLYPRTAPIRFLGRQLAVVIGYFAFHQPVCLKRFACHILLELDDVEPVVLIDPRYKQPRVLPAAVLAGDSYLLFQRVHLTLAVEQELHKYARLQPTLHLCLLRVIGLPVVDVYVEIVEPLADEASLTGVVQPMHYSYCLFCVRNDQPCSKNISSSSSMGLFFVISLRMRR